MRNPFSPIIDTGKRSNQRVEAVVTVKINGHEAKVTGSCLEELATLFNSWPNCSFALNLQGGPNYVGKSLENLASLTKTNLNVIKDVVFNDGEPVEFLFLTGTELHTFITTISTNPLFQEVFASAKVEDEIRAIGDIAYKEGMMMRAFGRMSYSPHSDPNIRRFRVEQAYRQMHNDAKKRQ